MIVLIQHIEDKDYNILKVVDNQIVASTGWYTWKETVFKQPLYPNKLWGSYSNVLSKPHTYKVIATSETNPEFFI